MKGINKILLMAGIGASLLASCNTDRDDNPTLQQPTSFRLETPEAKAYDMANNDTVHLDCRQPDYGFDAATTYAVQVSLQETFASETEYQQLSTTYSTESIDLNPIELNRALAEQYQAQHPGEEYIGKTVTGYFRLSANITNSTLGTCTSNTVKVENIKLSEIVIVLEPPTAMCLVGLNGDWDTWQPMTSVTQTEGEFWKIAWFDDGSGFKFGQYSGDWNGYANATITDNADATVGTDKDGNITIGNSGWYIVHVKGTVDGDAYKYAMTIYPPEVYVTGDLLGVFEYKDEWKFTVPTSKDGEFTSPALTADGKEVRMCAKFSTFDWWKLEFTLKNGTEIFYRENNSINNNWNDDMGAEYSLKSQNGKKIYLNFTEGTGRME